MQSLPPPPGPAWLPRKGAEQWLSLSRVRGGLGDTEEEPLHPRALLPQPRAPCAPSPWPSDAMCTCAPPHAPSA